jgi:hypothetical protein
VEGERVTKWFDHNQQEWLRKFRNKRVEVVYCTKVLKNVTAKKISIQDVK